LLLATDVENLRLRAERLAPQIAVGGIAGAAEPVQTASYLSTRRMVQDALPSWAIAVSPKDFSVRKLAEKLLAGPQPIAAMVENDRLLVNLRSVHPRHDLAIVEAFTAAPAQTTSEEPSVQPAL
jgi:hypothetical protein